jgi:hypothetical protein
MQCDNLELIAQEEPSGWSWMIEGLDLRYAAAARDEESAKNACLRAAKARLKRRGLPIPCSLNNPKWKSETVQRVTGMHSV